MKNLFNDTFIIATFLSGVSSAIIAIVQKKSYFIVFANFVFGNLSAFYLTDYVHTFEPNLNRDSTAFLVGTFAMTIFNLGVSYISKIEPKK